MCVILYEESIICVKKSCESVEFSTNNRQDSSRKHRNMPIPNLSCFLDSTSFRQEKFYHSIRPDIRFHSIPITSVIWYAINLVGVDDEQVNMSINAASSSSNYAMLLLHSCSVCVCVCVCTDHERYGVELKSCTVASKECQYN